MQNSNLIHKHNYDKYTHTHMQTFQLHNQIINSLNINDGILFEQICCSQKFITVVLVFVLVFVSTNSMITLTHTHTQR